MSPRRSVALARVLPLVLPLAALAGCGAARARGSAPETPVGRSATETDWRGQNVGQVEELFAGRFPGVQVYRTGGGLSIRIRGSGSLYGSGTPLYVVDGLPIDVGPQGLIDLNPSDIARIEVLKDAGSIAEYGVRGGNGVVRITTRRAR